MKYIGEIFTALLCILIIYVIYLLLYYKFDGDRIHSDTEKLAKKLQSHPIQALLNGSGINNIPNLNISTTNPQVAKANDCGNGPVFIGSHGSDHDCIRVCSNSSASVINVNEGDTFIYNQSTLQPGAHCVIGDRPQCNMKMTYAMMTVNSIVCRSKFPEIVGGDVGTTVVACNNRAINDPQNYLWDYANNSRFSPLETQMTSANERLPDGSYRFRCKFQGVDSQNNNYIENPLNRFHPFENYCAGLIYSAHPDVKTKIDWETQTFECDCGDFEKTRVRHIDPNDKSSQCSSKVLEITTDVKDREILHMPYRCFTLFSTIDEVGRYLPCPNEQFTVQGSKIASVNIPFSRKIEALVEHPVYKDFDENAGDVFMDLVSEIK